MAERSSIKDAVLFWPLCSILILFAVCIFGCGGVNESSSTARKIDQVINQANGATLIMRDVTDFPWDRFFVFEPYTLRETIHETVGVKFLKNDEISSSVDEAYCLLVFMCSGDIAEYFTYKRSRGDFDLLAVETNGFSRDAAFFEVMPEHGGRWKRIREMK